MRSAEISEIKGGEERNRSPQSPETIPNVLLGNNYNLRREDKERAEEIMHKTQKTLILVKRDLT